MKHSIKQAIKKLLIFSLALSVQFSFAQDISQNNPQKKERSAKVKKHSKLKHFSIDELQELNTQIRDIRKDTNLSPAEKSSKIKSLRKKFKVDRELSKEEIKEIKKEKQKRKSAITAKDNAGRNSEKHNLKREIQSIKLDENLSTEEKKTQIEKLRTTYRQTNKVSKRAEKTRTGKILKTKQIERGEIDPKRANKALKQLDKSESRIKKLLEKGKITDAEFSQKLNQINNIRAQLSAK